MSTEGTERSRKRRITSERVWRRVGGVVGCFGRGEGTNEKKYSDV